MRQAFLLAACGVLAISGLTRAVPAAPVESSAGPTATVVFAGGCYWGVESVFRHVRGVKHAVSGFAVPEATDPSAAPSMASTNYVEAVRVQYDPTQVTYQQLLQIFFLVAHDPTQVGHQGPDVGPEYRSVLFVADSTERRAVQAYLDQLAADKTYPAPIVTQLATLKRFREADPDQQNYAATHESDSYIVANDAPKLVELKRRYPQLYKE